ncbi:uncharacterized protein BDZ99DRAFT_134120 [Mytilinidion resinicola]|uniref:Uncharacterized protein n=1 Tax=Mytilinidion resinicola TaxID=574789 RepID=A0A6A6Z5H1_9PEZI|nr:uncharacterized protein BDZ99DRAFT_134120 [Mytilinidion resinicola]KAF2816346.1 hypothetical protein BDZ99DRAFT_134120 [Mytilinidion resinicola]
MCTTRPFSWNHRSRVLSHKTASPLLVRQTSPSCICKRAHRKAECRYDIYSFHPLESNLSRPIREAFTLNTFAYSGVSTFRSPRNPISKVWPLCRRCCTDTWSGSQQFSRPTIAYRNESSRLRREFLHSSICRLVSDVTHQKRSRWAGKRREGSYP